MQAHEIASHVRATWRKGTEALKAIADGKASAADIPEIRGDFRDTMQAVFGETGAERLDFYTLVSGIVAGDRALERDVTSVAERIKRAGLERSPQFGALWDRVITHGSAHLFHMLLMFAQMFHDAKLDDAEFGDRATNDEHVRRAAGKTLEQKIANVKLAERTGHEKSARDVIALLGHMHRGYRESIERAIREMPRNGRQK